ncbi:MAG: GNAT family N-acetyltransferase [Aeromicrobium sp.]|uniref:GNAT family N-acetyltransferase n=1 Tax=Aeromicrobium sp. TaxID=1871063 RepID=UPI003C348CD8
MLIDEVQAVYVGIYGNADVAPLDVAEFLPPRGHFVLARLDGVPAAMGGWRLHGPREGDAEIRRMYVRPAFTRRGLGRMVLAELERTASEVGARRMVLETGRPQPEAIALYRSAGYDDMESFGYYSAYDDSVHLGKILGSTSSRLHP